MSSAPSYLRVGNYRAFEAPAEPLELRPLTLLYGKNNAGKSTLVRLFGILADSLAEDANAPLMLDGRAGGGASFTDALFNRENGRITLTLGWRSPETLEATWVLSRDDNGFIEVERLEVRGSMGHAQYLSHRAVALPSAGATQVQSLRFSGLIPEVAADGSAALNRLRTLLRDLRGRIQWMSAVRATPERLARRPGAVPVRLATDGVDATSALLVHSRARDEVARWYAESCGRELRAEAAGEGLFRWRLPPLHNPALPVGLRDAGEGMTQALPVLAAVGMRAAPSVTGAGGDGAQVIAIEEPTTHLHDDLQIAMVRHLAAIAQAPDSPVMILETHARPMLLGVQLAIAKGDIDEDKVGVWWVEQDEDGRSSYRRVRFDGDGTPTDDTLMHVFDDQRRLLRELAAAKVRPEKM